MPSKLITSLSVCIPIYNEADNIKKLLDSILNIIDDITFSYEIILVNDGSCDNTSDQINEYLSVLPNNNILVINHSKNRGYGAAVKTGFEASSKEYIFLIDGDNQFDLSDLHKNLNLLDDESNSIYIGYRKCRADNKYRIINANLYNIIIKMLLPFPPIKDIDCAFKLFPRDAIKGILPLISNGAIISAELIYKIHNNGYKIIEFEVNHYKRLFGESSGGSIYVIKKAISELLYFVIDVYISRIKGNKFK
jgi:glycosyltransferase involved in cell wall biosynthesis